MSTAIQFNLVCFILQQPNVGFNELLIVFIAEPPLYSVPNGKDRSIEVLKQTFDRALALLNINHWICRIAK